MTTQDHTTAQAVSNIASAYALAAAAHASTLAAMPDSELLSLLPSSPFESELIRRLQTRAAEEFDRLEDAQVTIEVLEGEIEGLECELMNDGDLLAENAALKARVTKLERGERIRECVDKRTAAAAH